ncbi:hypothetical protein PLESTB_000700600 [Pleodorina starrii]|uniref:Hemerythrin-like domain-containing protein n=1 Tax=Pleodorina starrii TaxID=330485 RepID=A0A9W6BKD9_9CHLO|nr:hypothetical protein PLESTB_000700600 [Pleodorina starrii]
MASTDVPTHQSVITMINQDHANFKSMWNEYNGPNMNNEMKQKLGWALIREIAMHSSAEEEVMYPEIRKRLGDEAADHLLGHDGHQKIKDLLYEANNMTIEKNGEAAYTAKLDEAMKVLYHHISDEESKTWPTFEALPGVDADLLSHLGTKFESAKGHAVTRPHPWAPNKPPLNLTPPPAPPPAPQQQHQCAAVAVATAVEPVVVQTGGSGGCWRVLGMPYGMGGWAFSRQA